MRELLLLFVLTVFLTYPVHSQTGSDWKWLHPTPQGNQLRAVQVFSASTWYAVGYAGTFMKTTDAGSTWEFNHKAGNPFTKNDFKPGSRLLYRKMYTASKAAASRITNGLPARK